MKTNEKFLVMQGVQGTIANPTEGRIIIGNDGKPRQLPIGGSINYGIHVGAPAYGWAAEEVHSGVTISNEKECANNSLRQLSCIGNQAIVMNGEADGAVGTVVGFHDNEIAAQVMIEFSNEDMEKMKIGDTIMIKAYGIGLALKDYPTVKVTNIDPGLLKKLNITENEGKIEVPVRFVIPEIVNGASSRHGDITDAEINLTISNEEEIRAFGLQDMRLGDIVYLSALDSAYSCTYLRSAGTIGIVVHGNTSEPSNGVGIVAIMTSKDSMIIPKIDDAANIKNFINDYAGWRKPC